MNATGGPSARGTASPANTANSASVASLVDHPTEAMLRRFALGELELASQDAIERHVEACDRCCAVLRTAPDDTLVANLKADNSAAVPSDLPPLGLAAPSSPVLAAPLPAELRDHPRYRIIKQVGAGGMGVVYKAEHRFMERLVALKVINRRLLRNANALERFRLEVKAAARLSHPNIVTAHDADQAGELHILVMEYVDGISVARQVEKGGPLPVKHACQFARQAALGLQHAHERGMAHRDIKPQNLMLTKDGRVKILDFGLARLVRERESPPVADETLDGAAQGGDLTRDGTALGTPDYMAPEQIRSARDADIRSDIYALGGTLYFMLAGHSPFPHGSVADKLVAHLDHQPLDLSLVRPDVPTSLIQVIERMMAKNPAERFASPQQVADALTPFCKSSGAVAQTRAAGVPAAATAPPAIDWLATPTGEPLPPLSEDASSFAQVHASRFDHVARGLRSVPNMVARRPGLFVVLAMLAILLLILMAGGLNWFTGHSSSEPVHNSDRPALSAAPSSISLPSREAAARVLIYAPASGGSTYELELVRKATRYFFGEYEITSSIRGPIPLTRGSAGTEEVRVGVAINEVNIADYSALVVLGQQDADGSDSTGPGTASTEQLTASRLGLLRVVRELNARRRPVAAIGQGIVLLAETGALRDHSVARYHGVADQRHLAHQANWRSDRVVEDGLFVTGADAAATKEVVQRLARIAAPRSTTAYGQGE